MNQNMLTDLSENGRPMVNATSDRWCRFNWCMKKFPWMMWRNMALKIGIHSMTHSKHDTLVYRLSQILIKLNSGAKLIPSELAQEFGVNLRTIQRDLNVRFAHLPINRVGSAYVLDPVYLGKLSEPDIRRFAEVAGINKLFPSMDTDFVLGLLRDKGYPSVVVRGHNYEDLGNTRELFEALEAAIKDHQTIHLNYSKSGTPKLHASLKPYRLLNSKGIWYLVAVDLEGSIKSFSFTKIKGFELTGQSFTSDPDTRNIIESTDGIWFSRSGTEVILKVSQEVAQYFHRRKIVDNQTILRVLEDGSLHIKVTVADFRQILPIIRYWIPNVVVVSPDALRAELTSSLQSYLQQVAKQST